MEVFELIVYEKIKIWRRNYVKVKANSIEEAINQCLESDPTVEIKSSEILYETEEGLDVSDEDPCTIEILDSHYKTLKTNYKML